jgi:hypothetical protein
VASWLAKELAKDAETQPISDNLVR